MEAYRAIRNARAAVARDAEKVVNPMTETPEKPTIH